MVAYLIFTQDETLDSLQLQQYAALVPTATKGHDIKILARYGRFETLEGEPNEGTVILEFPSFEEAKLFYHSPAYQTAATHRNLGAKFHVSIVQGV